MGSALACLLSNSWISIWVALEVNTLSFCSMNRASNKTPDVRIKYFIIQSIPSAILIFSVLIIKTAASLKLATAATAVIALVVKSAGSPFQEWFIKITKITNTNNATVLITWQKLAPSYLLIFQIKKIIIPFIILSIITGAILQLNKNKIIEILRYSSVFNLGWIMMILILSRHLYLTYTVLYWSTVVLIILYLNKTNFKNINETNTPFIKKWQVLLIIANLAGIPPLTGFVAKWLVLKEGIQNFNLIITVIVLTTRVTNFYVYLRIMLKILTKKRETSQEVTKKIKKSTTILNNIFIAFPIIILWL